MARPCKSAKLLTEKSQTKGEISARTEQEERLRSASGKLPVPPRWLTDSQKKIFRMIVKELSSADILCRLDVWILQECAVAVDCLNQIGADVNERPELIYSKEVLSAKEKYTKIFFGAAMSCRCRRSQGLRSLTFARSPMTGRSCYGKFFRVMISIEHINQRE